MAKFNSQTARAAGEKSKRGPDIAKLTAKDLSKPEKTKQAWESLEHLVFHGESEAVRLNALKLYLAYVLGEPEKTITQNNTGEREIVIIRDGDTYPPVRTTSGTTADTTEPETV